MFSKKSTSSATSLPINYGLSQIVQSFKVAMCTIACALLFSLINIHVANAQTQGSPAPFILTPPIVDYLDSNHVSMITGKPQFTIPVLSLGDVSFTPYTYNGHFQYGGVIDHNYGRIAQCQGAYPPYPGGYPGTWECTLGGTSYGVQPQYGEESDTFVYSGSSYYSYTGNGSTFVDNGSTCTWTRRDGTQIIYAAFHISGNPMCASNNITKIIYPNGRIATYFYSGTFSTTVGQYSPIISIAMNSGYMLKYNYSGTPAFGSETSVTAINRAFETCNPSALTCTLTRTWPTAKLTWQIKTVSPCDGYPSLGTGYNSCNHYILTIQDAAHRNHVFELDSYCRVVSYQPSEATTPVFTYKLCSNLGSIGAPLRDCFGYTTWTGSPGGFDPVPQLLDLASTVAKDGQTWGYSSVPSQGVVPYNSTWAHFVTHPLGKTMEAHGNATPGTEVSRGGSIGSITTYDGKVVAFAYSVNSLISTVTTPEGIQSQYGYDARGNLASVKTVPKSGSGNSSITVSAGYPTSCSNLVTCNKPTYTMDAKNNETDFTYDPTHGGTLTVTFPAVTVTTAPGVSTNGIRPQTRYTYAKRNAWYLSNSGVMTKDPNPIWVLTGESFCRTSSALASPSNGCTDSTDAVVTSYDYGPDSGPNNLLVRGKAMTANGTTLRTCYGHDPQGNKIWETSPNAAPSSCPTY